MRDLQVVFEGGQGLGGGQLVATIGFVNIAETACVLEGVPGFTLLDAAGKVITTTSSGYRITNRNSPVLLAPWGKSRQAYLPFTWPAVDQSNGGSSCPSASVASAIRLDLRRGGGTITVSTVSPTGRPVAIAPCHGLLAVGTFQGVEPAIEPTPTPHPFVYHVALPRSVRAGDSLRYTVTFTNVSGSTYFFGDPCPAYREELYPRQGAVQSPLGKHFYLLNCRPVSSIAARASVTFAMVVDVPSNAPPGPYALLWEPDEGTDLQDIQRLAIDIVS